MIGQIVRDGIGTRSVCNEITVIISQIGRRAIWSNGVANSWRRRFREKRGKLIKLKIMSDGVMVCEIWRNIAIRSGLSKTRSGKGSMRGKLVGVA